MSGPITLATSLRNALLNALRDALNGGSVEIYDGAAPVSPDAPLDGHTLLGAFTLPNPCAPDAGFGELTLSAIDPSTGLADGTAGWARLRAADATAQVDLPIGASGAGVAFELASTQIELGQPVSVTAARFAFA